MYVRVYVCIYVFLYACMYACIFVCDVCMYVCHVMLRYVMFVCVCMSEVFFAEVALRTVHGLEQEHFSISLSSSPCLRNALKSVTSHL